MFCTRLESAWPLVTVSLSVSHFLWNTPTHKFFVCCSLVQVSAGVHNIPTIGNIWENYLGRSLVLSTAEANQNPEAANHNTEGANHNPLPRFNPRLAPPWYPVSLGKCFVSGNSHFHVSHPTAFVDLKVRHIYWHTNPRFTLLLLSHLSEAWINMINSLEWIPIHVINE